MTISTFLQQQEVEDHSAYALEISGALESYRTLTIHCLIAGNYLRPNRHTMETLTLHFAVDQNMNIDTNIGNWMLIGVVIRVALRMGLHRDPSHWPNIRPLDAEHRRRLWLTLYHMDFFTSTQVGLPRIIKDSQCDARLPANLFNDDLSLEIDVMPPERPLTDPTPLSFIIQRSIIIKVAAEIYDATEAGPPPLAAIATLGAKFEEAVDSIPEQSKYRPLDASIADSPVTILHRMFLDILIHKAVYLLHRRSFVNGSTEADTSESNKLCINAALSILKHQRSLSDESQPGGIMFGIRWRVPHSLNHEFLQATMMLCFALNQFHQGCVGSISSRSLHRQHDILEALRIAKGLWERNSTRSVEARRAAAAITSMLKHEQDRCKISTQTDLGVGEDAFDLHQPANIGNSTGVSQSSAEMAQQSFIAGSFDPDRDLKMDSSFFADDVDLAAIGSFWDDFVADPAPQAWAGPR